MRPTCGNCLEIEQNANHEVHMCDVKRPTFESNGYKCCNYSDSYHCLNFHEQYIVHIVKASTSNFLKVIDRTS